MPGQHDAVSSDERDENERESEDKEENEGGERRRTVIRRALYTTRRACGGGSDRARGFVVLEGGFPFAGGCGFDSLRHFTRRAVLLSTS